MIRLASADSPLPLLSYRPDIDGMRAMAVGAVVLFHMGLSPMSGGFTGVDVFFVISGYLMTAIITREIAERTFTFRSFYTRRIRRIAPALLATLLVTLLAGFFILAPLHYRMLGQSTIAAVLSVSNILFWHEAGYFDEAALYKPLLHTWSLGVEEQFYVVWPVLLYFLLRRGRRFGSVALIMLSAASLVSAELLLGRMPDSVFFLTPFRVFEFGFGAILALERPTIARDRERSALSVLGLSLIILAVFVFDETTRFPGVSAVVPSLGTAMVIAAGPTALVNRILALGPVVYIGRISYSLYLVHWPIVIYYNYLFGPPKILFETIFLTVASVALGAAMYHAVEVPYRARQAGSGDHRIGQRPLLRRTVAVSFAILLFSAAVSAERGMPWRMPADLVALMERIDRDKAERIYGIRATNCQFSADSTSNFYANFENCLPEVDDAVIAVVGDSHAADLWYALSRRYPDRSFVQLTGDGCSFSRVEGMDPECFGFLTFAEDWIVRHTGSLDLVIYTQRAAHLMAGDPIGLGAPLRRDSDAEARIVTRLEHLAENGVSVVFWGPRAEFHPNIEVVAAASRSRREIQRKYDENDLTQFAALDRKLAADFEDSVVKYLSTIEALCEERCPVFLPDGDPLFIDYAHWSPEGGLWAVDQSLAKVPKMRALLEGGVGHP